MALSHNRHFTWLFYATSLIHYFFFIALPFFSLLAFSFVLVRNIDLTLLLSFVFLFLLLLVSLIDLIYLAKIITCRLLNSISSSSSKPKVWYFLCIQCNCAALVWPQISSDLLRALCQLRIKSSKRVSMNWMPEKCSQPNQIPGNTPVWIKY